MPDKALTSFTVSQCEQ